MTKVAAVAYFQGTTLVFASKQ